jgi:hypothetical protein
MPSQYPEDYDSLPNPDASLGQNLNTPGFLHDDQHSNANDAIEAIQQFVGTEDAAAGPATLVGRIKTLEAGGGGGGGGGAGLSGSTAFFAGLPAGEIGPHNIPLILALPDGADPGFATVNGDGELVIRDAGIYWIEIGSQQSETAAPGGPKGNFSLQDLDLAGLRAFFFFAETIAGGVPQEQWYAVAGRIFVVAEGAVGTLFYTYDDDFNDVLVVVTKIGTIG